MSSALPCGCDPGVRTGYTNPVTGVITTTEYRCKEHRRYGSDNVTTPVPSQDATDTAPPAQWLDRPTNPKVEPDNGFVLRLGPTNSKMEPEWQSAEDQLRKQNPHGHPRFLPITLKEIELHSAKNHDYAQGGPPLGNFERVSQILALYPELKLSDQRVVALVYLMKQMDAVLWGLNSNIEHKVEGLNQRLQDISVYCKLVICMCEDLAKEGL